MYLPTFTVQILLPYNSQRVVLTLIHMRVQAEEMSSI